jgi:ubiquinone/menaquinone biosynthesis C-methylase UbiE
MPPMKQSLAVRLTDSDVLEALALRTGMCVAEIGGARFPEAIASAVGPQGRVLAADTSSLAGLPDACCDRVLMTNIWLEAGDPVDVLREAARLLRPDGRLVVIESRVDFPELLKILENNCWDVHRHGEAGAQCYFIEAAISDESVQS